MPLEASLEDLSKVWENSSPWKDCVVDVGDILVWRSLGRKTFATFIVQTIEDAFNGKAATAMCLTSTSREIPQITVIFFAWYDPNLDCIVKVDNPSWKVLGK